MEGNLKEELNVFTSKLSSVGGIWSRWVKILPTILRKMCTDAPRQHSFPLPKCSFLWVSNGKSNSRALEEKVWQYPFVRHLSFLLYFTFKISAGEPFSFYPFVRHVSSILHFAARGETEHWTLLHSCFLQILKVGFQNPAHNSIFIFFVFVYEYHSCHIMIRDRCYWIQYIYLNCNMLFIVNYFNCLQLHWSNCKVSS